MQDTGKTEREFRIGTSKTIPLLNDFLAVSNSTLWLTFYAENYTSGGFDIHIHVFDDKGFYSEHTFIALPKEGAYPVEPDMKFENGNQTIAFASPSGQKIYNVLSDTLVEVK